MVPDYTPDLGWSASWGATGSLSKERSNEEPAPKGRLQQTRDESGKRKLRNNNRSIWAGSEGLHTFNEQLETYPPFQCIAVHRFVLCRCFTVCDNVNS